MRIHSLVLVAACIAAPVAAQELGARTQSPEAQLRAYGLSQGQDDLREALAAAEAHPLGSAQNPVRVGGPPGERAYLARLRCANGVAPRIGQRANAGTGAFGTIVDVFPLDCGSAAPGRVSLVMDMYHEEHREDRSPPGFTITPR